MLSVPVHLRFERARCRECAFNTCFWQLQVACKGADADTFKPLWGSKQPKRIQQARWLECVTWCSNSSSGPMAVSAMSFNSGVHRNHYQSRFRLSKQLNFDLEQSRRPITTKSSSLENAKSIARRATVRCCSAAFNDAPTSFRYGTMLSDFSSWGIGGPAKMFVEVTTSTEMASVLRYCTSHDVRWFVVGKGSNCLFDDRGFDGCIILNRIEFLEKQQQQDTWGGVLYRVGSGYGFNMLGVQCCRDGFSGLEFAGGIPGTVGGAVFMNAGADGQETGDVVQNVEIVTTSGVASSLSRSAGELKFQYRTSPFQEMRDSAVIVAATFALQPNSDAKQRQRMYLERRRRTQPVSERSAGCVFQNPGAGCHSAGALIEQAGLKGAAIGGARISSKHANFLINGGGCKSGDMLALIALVKEQVHAKYGLWLHDEILYVPYNHDGT